MQHAGILPVDEMTFHRARPRHILRTTMPDDEPDQPSRRSFSPTSDKSGQMHGKQGRRTLAVHSAISATDANVSLGPGRCACYRPIYVLLHATQCPSGCHSQGLELPMTQC